LISTPAYVMLLVSRFSESMTTADTIFARILMGLVMVEFFADQQQWGKYLFDNIYRYTV
jgi:F0F1-type ATP synthase beta subunit